jgi:hypothetical protein
MPVVTNEIDGEQLDDVIDLFCDYQTRQTDTNDDRGMQEIISFLEEGAPQSTTDSTESSFLSGNPVQLGKA